VVLHHTQEIKVTESINWKNVKLRKNKLPELSRC